MSSNDGLNLLAIVAGVRAIVDAVDTALELWHALPAHITDTGALEVGDRWSLCAGVDVATIGLGVLVDRPTARDPGDDTTVRVTLTAGPFHAAVSYDGRTEADLEALDVVDHGDDTAACRCSRSMGMAAVYGPHALWCPARTLGLPTEAYLDDRELAGAGAR